MEVVLDAGGVSVLSLAERLGVWAPTRRRGFNGRHGSSGDGWPSLQTRFSMENARGRSSGMVPAAVEGDAVEAGPGLQGCFGPEKKL